LLAEQAGEVVRDHVVGTCARDGSLAPKSADVFGQKLAGVDGASDRPWRGTPEKEVKSTATA
jgi:hypothetical protein